MLRPGQALALPVRSPAMVFHVIEGSATVQAETLRFELDVADTCRVPGDCAVSLANASAATPTCLFIADATPLHRTLGVLETRARRRRRLSATSPPSA